MKPYENLFNKHKHVKKTFSFALPAVSNPPLSLVSTCLNRLRYCHVIGWLDICINKAAECIQYVIRVFYKHLHVT